jgi:hypothetical protein
MASSHFSVKGVKWSSKRLLPSSISAAEEEEMLQEEEDEEEVNEEVNDDDFLAKKQRGIFNLSFLLDVFLLRKQVQHTLNDKRNSIARRNNSRLLNHGQSL